MLLVITLFILLILIYILSMTLLYFSFKRSYREEMFKFRDDMATVVEVLINRQLESTTALANLKNENFKNYHQTVDKVDIFVQNLNEIIKREIKNLPEPIPQPVIFNIDETINKFHSDILLHLDGALNKANKIYSGINLEMTRVIINKIEELKPKPRVRKKKVNEKEVNVEECQEE